MINCLSTCFDKVRVGNIDDGIEKSLKTRFIYESDENSPKDALHIYAVTGPAAKRNETVLYDLSDALYTIEANVKIPDNFKNPLATIQVAQNQKHTNKF